MLFVNECSSSRNGKNQSATALNHNPASHPHLAFIHCFVPRECPSEAPLKLSRRAAEYIVNVHKIFTSYGQGTGLIPVGSSFCPDACKRGRHQHEYWNTLARALQHHVLPRDRAALAAHLG